MHPVTQAWGTAAILQDGSVADSYTGIGLLDFLYKIQKSHKGVEH